MLHSQEGWWLPSREHVLEPEVSAVALNVLPASEGLDALLLEP